MTKTDVNDLTVGDTVIYSTDTGDFDRIGTITKIVPMVSAPKYLYFVRDVDFKSVTGTDSFFRNELIKTYSDIDLDNQIKTLNTL